MFFDKTDNGGTDKVWLYQMENDGYSLDDKRLPIENSDIDDIVSRFCKDSEAERTRFDKSFFVTKEEIVAKKYSLKFNDYRKIQRKQVTYRSSNDIIKDIDDLEAVFNDLLSKIR